MRNKVVDMLVKAVKNNDTSIFNNTSIISPLKQIIRTKPLSSRIQNFLFKDVGYRKHVVKYQDKLSPKIRNFYIDNCADIGFTDHHLTFMERDDLTVEEANKIHSIISSKKDYAAQHKVIINYFNYYFDLMYRTRTDDSVIEHAVKTLGVSTSREKKMGISIIANLLNTDLREFILSALLERHNQGYISSLLILDSFVSIFKLYEMCDEVADYIIENFSEENAKQIFKNALSRNNLSELMIAKVYLLLG